MTYLQTNLYYHMSDSTMIPFTKMHGLGNDFVVIDGITKPFDLTQKDICAMADRHTGIGFDQLLLIEPSTEKDVDFNYRIFNADGNEVEQCGNGARCIARFLKEGGFINKNEIIVATRTGRLKLQLKSDNQVMVEMGIPQFDPSKIPFKTEEASDRYELKIESYTLTIGVVNIGNPHAVLKVNDVSKAPVQEWGPVIERLPVFPHRVNVGFMEIIDAQCIRLRVFERGVGETMACGSGACAAVAVGKKWGLLNSHVTVHVKGGDLSVIWEDETQPLWLVGPAEFVYKGEWLK